MLGNWRFVPLGLPLTPSVPETLSRWPWGPRAVCRGDRLLQSPAWGLQAEACESQLSGRHRCHWLPSPRVVDCLNSDFGSNLGAFGSKERKLPGERKWTDPA